MAQPDVSVVIPTLNGGPLFKRCLSALATQETARSTELVVIDSGSSDGTVEAAQSAGARVLHIRRSEFNHGATRDQAIAESRGRFVVLTVQDAEPADGHWLERLVEALESEPDASGAYSRQLPRPDLNPILRRRLEGWSASRAERDVQRLPSELSFDSLDPWQRLALVSFDDVSSCVRRDIWRRIPFGPRRFGEDLCWATRCIRAGLAIVYEPGSVVIHSHDSTVGYEFRRLFADHRNLSELLGLVTVPDLRSVRRNARAARLAYLELLAGEALPEPRRRHLEAWASRYALAENLAQYLGARCARAAREPGLRARFYRLLESRILRGV